MIRDKSAPARGGTHLRSGPCAFPQVRASGLGSLPKQLQLGGQGKRVQVISVDDGPPRTLSQRPVCLRVGECIHHIVRDRRGVEEIHEQSVLPMAQDFLHWRGPRADHETSGREGLQHRPGENEGIGEIYVHPGDLEDCKECRIGHPAQEMYPAEVEGVPELLQHLFPIGFAVRKSRAIAHLIAADNDHLSLGTSGEDGRKAAHEALEPPVRLEIASDICDDLIIVGQLTTTIRQTQLGGGIGLHDPRVDSLMDDAQHRVVTLWIEGLLPARGALAEVGCLETEKVAYVLGAKSRSGVELLGNPGLEFYICAFSPIEELEVSDEGNPGIDVLQVPDFTPPVVAEHDVGDEASLLERQGGAGDFLTIQDSGFSFPQVMVRFLGDSPLRCIHDLPDRRQRPFSSLGEKDYLFIALDTKMACKVEILTGEVLMSDEDSHILDCACRAGSPRIDSTILQLLL